MALDPMQPFEHITVSTELTKEQKARANQLLRTTAVIALPGGGMGRRPETVEDVLDLFEHVKEYLGSELRAHEETRQKLWALEADIKAAGRLFKLVADA